MPAVNTARQASAGQRQGATTSSVCIDLSHYAPAVAQLSVEEEGVLLRIIRLASQETGGLLNANEEALRQACNVTPQVWQRVRQRILRYLQLEEGYLRLSPTLGVTIKRNQPKAPHQGSSEISEKIRDLLINALQEFGIGYERARTLLRSWAKEYGVGQTVAAILALERTGKKEVINDPMRWITGRLAYEQRRPDSPVKAQQPASNQNPFKQTLPLKADPPRMSRRLERPDILPPAIQAQLAKAVEISKAPLLPVKPRGNVTATSNA